MKTTTTKKKTNKPFILMGQEVDFIDRKIVFFTVRNYIANMPGIFSFNVLGVIIKEKDGLFNGYFRIKYPSGNKTQVALKRTSKDDTGIKLDLTTGLDELFAKELKATKDDFWDIPVPENAQDPDGFMAILRACNLFDITRQEKVREE